MEQRFSTTPSGPSQIYQRGTGKLMYLVPDLSTNNIGLFAVRFAKPLPSNVFSDRWTSQQHDCGGNCGGFDVRWNMAKPSDGPPFLGETGQADPDGKRGGFYVVPRAGEEGVWTLKYTLDRYRFGVQTEVGGLEVVVWA